MMSLQNPLEDYGLENIIRKLNAENEQLKARISLLEMQR